MKTLKRLVCITLLALPLPGMSDGKWGDQRGNSGGWKEFKNLVLSDLPFPTPSLKKIFPSEPGLLETTKNATIHGGFVDRNYANSPISNAPLVLGPEWSCSINQPCT